MLTMLGGVLGLTVHTAAAALGLSALLVASATAFTVLKIAGAVYLLCFGTALACAVLLLRAYQRRRIRLLLWCGLFFAASSIENAILFVDLVVIGPDINLTVVRRSVAMLGMALLLYGLTVETK